MSSSAIVLALHFALFRSLDELVALMTHDWLLLGILGIACMFVPGLMQAEGVRRVGAQRAAIGSTVGPPTTIVLAALFLGERLNGWQLLGSAMIVVSVLLMSLRPADEVARRLTSRAAQPRHAPACRACRRSPRCRPPGTRCCRRDRARECPRGGCR